MNFEKYFPLTQIKFGILSELYLNNFNLQNLTGRLGKSKQLIFQTINSMEMIDKDENNVYSINKYFLILFEIPIRFYLLIKRLGKYFDILPYLKKHTNPIKIILFGSCAKENIYENSDIGIYLIANNSEKEIDKLSFNLSNLFIMEIQLIVVNPKMHLTKKYEYFKLYETILGYIKEGINVELSVL